METDLPEVIDFAEAKKTVGVDALYLDPRELHDVGDNRILRYDMTLPFLLTVRSKRTPGPARLWSAGKVYRVCQSDSQHLEAFHQGEALWIDEVGKVDPWLLAGRILKSVESLRPGSVVRIVPTQYPMCSQAWELEIEHQGEWSEVMAWGTFTNKIVSFLGVDPIRYSAVGVCYGLERFAMLRYDIDDIRKLEAATVS
jgi:phenylalanyl-tRNA synthetase alpha chain